MSDIYDTAIAPPSGWIDGQPGLREALDRWNAVPRDGGELVGVIGRPGIGFARSAIRRWLDVPSASAQLWDQSRRITGRASDLIGERSPGAVSLLSTSVAATGGPSGRMLMSILSSMRPDILRGAESAWAPPPAMSRAVVRQRIRPATRGRLVDLEDDPVSVSEYDQVHRGRLIDGTAVAVAVSRPGVARRMLDDASMLGPCLVAAEFVDPSPWRDGLVEILRDLTASGIRRCDQRAVALDAAVLQAALAGSDVSDLAVARPIPELVDVDSAVYALGIDGVESRPTDSAILAAGVATIVETGLVQGVYSTHLDPGYMWADQHGMTTLVGGTSVGLVQEPTRRGLAEMLMGAGSTANTADALVAIGVLPPFVDRDDLAGRLATGGLGNPFTLLGPDGVSRLKDAGRSLVVEHGARATPELIGLTLAVFRLVGAVRSGATDRTDLLRVLPRLAGIGSRMSAAA